MKRFSLILTFLVAVTHVFGCKTSELPELGNRLAGPVGLAVTDTHLYVTNANNNLEYRSGSLIAVDLSLIDATNRSHFINDVVQAQLPLPNFSGPIEIADVFGTSTALITNRLSEGELLSAPDELMFIELDPGNTGLTYKDIDLTNGGVQSSIIVGEDPFGMAQDPATNTLYVANESSGNISVLSLVDDCERQGTETPPEAAPCVEDALGSPEGTVPVFVPVDTVTPSDVEMNTVGVTQGLTPTDNWTLTFIEDPFTCPDGLGFWRVRAQVLGAQNTIACTNIPYQSDVAEVIFLVRHVEGVVDPVGPVQGDEFTFETTAGDFIDFSPIPLDVETTEGFSVSGRGVSQVAHDPVTGLVYGTSRNSSFVYVVDPVSGLPDAIVPVGTQSGTVDARGIVVSPTGDEVYVVKRNPDALLVISPAAFGTLPGAELVDEAVVDAIALGPQPAGAVLTADGAHVLIVCSGDGSIYAVDRLTRNVAGIGQAGTGAFSIVLSPDGTRGFIANYGEDTISIIDADRTSPDYLRLITTIHN